MKSADSEKLSDFRWLISGVLRISKNFEALGVFALRNLQFFFFFSRKNVLDLLGENFLIKTFQTLNRLV